MVVKNLDDEVNDVSVGGTCSCTAGKGTCNHMVAVLYQLVHYQNLQLKKVPPVLTKTSLPQQWHVPRTQGIHPGPVSELTVAKVRPTSSSQPSAKKRRTVTGNNQ